MKRRDFISMTVATTAMAAVAGARPKARQQPAVKLTFVFVGGAYFVPLTDRYLALHPAGHEGVVHRAFIVGPSKMALGNVPRVPLPARYPLQVMHPDLGTAGNHSVFCLDKTDVIVGGTGRPMKRATKLAEFTGAMTPGKKPKDNWHQYGATVTNILSARFQLLGSAAEIIDGKELNSEGAAKTWQGKDHAKGKPLTDVTLFVTESRNVEIKHNGQTSQAQLPSGDVQLYVFGGPTESNGKSPKASYEYLEHPEVLKHLYQEDQHADLRLKANSPVIPPFAVQITHPCDFKHERAFTHRMIPPDTEFCVNEEGPEPGP